MDDFHSPANNSTEMLYDDALGNSYYFWFNYSLYIYIYIINCNINKYI